MNIKEYLSKVKALEMSVYEIDNAINRLIIQKNSIADNPGYKNKIENVESDLDIIDDLIFRICIILGIVIGAIVSLVMDIHSDGYADDWLIAKIISGFFVLIRGGLIGIVAGFLGGIMLSVITYPIRNYFANNADARKNYTINKENQRIDEFNMGQRDIAQRKINIINSEIHSLSIHREKAISTLNSLYNLNIIVPAFRNIVAVFAFYEYFDMGLCTSLEGHEGAYNLYREDMKYKSISGKLDDIISRLDDMSEGQQYLREAVIESNVRVNRIVSEVKNMSDRLEDINRNSQINAYNSSISKSYLEALTWIESYKLLK